MYALASPHSAAKAAPPEAANGGAVVAPLPPPRIDLRSDTVTLPTPAVRAVAPCSCADTCAAPIRVRCSTTHQSRLRASRLSWRWRPALLRAV
jgi:hypothetical protein